MPVTRWQGELRSILCREGRHAKDDDEGQALERFDVVEAGGDSSPVARTALVAIMEPHIVGIATTLHGAYMDRGEVRDTCAA
jgi:hypothetical protein